MPEKPDPRMRSSSPSVPKDVKDTKKPARQWRPWLWKWTKRLTVTGAVLAIAGLVAGWLVLREWEKDLPSVTDLEKGYHPSQVTRVLARDGTLLAEMFTQRRTVIGIDDMAPQMKLAVLAAEDANFYNHEGINYLGIVRAAVVNLRSGRTRQGGSTITQQVVKNILLETNERTYKRKMREALLARRLEQELCPECGNDEAGKRKRKDKILELYLNHIYFGNGRYGIEEAAKYNFGKSAKELTVAEAAMLAGIPAGPEIYAPKHDLKRALSRRAFVLDQMHAKGFLNDAQYDAAKDEPVHLAPTVEMESDLAPEAVAIARKMLLELEPARASGGGFTITTTIDPKMQQAARKAVREDLEAYDKRHSLNAPFRGSVVAATTTGKGKKPAPPPPAREAPFEGTPTFESHKVYNGVVWATDDVAGTIDVRVGTVVGTLKIADYKRYNPDNLAPSKFAEAGARLRVSLLAPVPNVGADVKTATSKVPLRLEQGPEGAMVMLDVRTRQILALVGSYEGVSGGLDRATQSKRQPGSTFKPIVYATALNARTYTPATLVDPKPMVFPGGYRPGNYEGYAGADPLRLRECLANSVNVAAVHVISDVGPSNVVALARALGIQSKLEPDLSLALGSYEVHPMELAGAYATFAAGGMYDEPRLVTRIVGPDGVDVPLKELPPQRRVMDPAEAYIITNMLGSVVDHGTAQKAKVLGAGVAGKTGTSNDSKDTWFAGFTTDVAAVTWIGYDDAKPLGSGETGAQTALPAWVTAMKTAREGKPKAEFPRPPGLVSVQIDPKSGKLAAADQENAMEEIFLSGSEPTETADSAADAGAAGDP